MEIVAHTNAAQDAAELKGSQPLLMFPPEECVCSTTAYRATTPKKILARIAATAESSQSVGPFPFEMFCRKPIPNVSKAASIVTSCFRRSRAAARALRALSAPSSSSVIGTTDRPWKMNALTDSVEQLSHIGARR